jgi:hypothetical protein
MLHVYLYTYMKEIQFNVKDYRRPSFSFNFSFIFHVTHTDMIKQNYNLSRCILARNKSNGLITEFSKEELGVTRGWVGRQTRLRIC